MPGRSLRLALLALAGCAPSAPLGPDVVLIVADTLRRDALGTYGAPTGSSPCLDALAARGLVYEDCVAQCSWTRPSMVSLLQGVPLPRYRDRPVEELSTLAEELSARGYACIAGVANPLVGEDAGFARGFGAFHLRTQPPATPGGVPLGGTWSEVWEAVEPELEATPADQPLFLYLHLMEPHAPYRVDPRWSSALAPEAARPLDPALARAAQGPAPLSPGEDEAWAEAEQRIQADRLAYAHAVRTLDEGIGEVVARVRALRADRDPVFVVGSDHGEALYDCLAPPAAGPVEAAAPEARLMREHGRVLAEPLIRVPLLVFGGGVPQGQRVRGPVENLDLFPTLLALAAAGDAPSRGGGSLHPWGGAPDRGGLAFAAVLHERAVRDSTSGLKLVVPTPVGEAEGRRAVLTDWREDPAGLRDLSLERAEERAALQARLGAWVRTHGTPSSLDSSDPAVLRALGYAGPSGAPLPLGPAPERD